MPGTDPQLLQRLGLRAGEAVRFRRGETGRWLEGRIHGVAADGSVTLHDRDGAARSLRPERLEVRRASGRGRLVWRCVTEVAVTWQQLDLWSEADLAAPSRHPGPSRSRTTSRKRSNTATSPITSSDAAG